ncbi:sulfite exporter TauE/SafE family protein [Krasilnikovia sp. M28-CT-15]|uniref:sulfite exporter TauE/SafE family protein n=1 Tax=Krasilnikovia sp. M28-CT-15 TaxID=3373540 RepID=UPI003876AFBF
MTWSAVSLAFAAGVLISTVTTPVGVSGAVFLLPVQLSVFAVPSPAVTPTNLLYNVVSGPGALWRYRRLGTLAGPLTRLLLAGTLPGVVVGAVIRVFAVPGPRVFRVIIAALLLPLGLWLCLRAVRPPQAADTDAPPRPADSDAPPRPAGDDAPPRRSRGRVPSGRAVTGLGLAVGVVGGIYGIGGGSLLGPILVGRGMSVTRVAPAALAATFVTSIVGVAAYGLLALGAPGAVAPHWGVGLASGLGGLIGGYLGARLQPRLPERGLRLLLGVLATGLAVLYLSQAAG